MRDGFAIVDADGHLAEPADVFDGRIDEKYLERAPRILRTEDGRQGMSFLGNPPAVGMFGSGDAIVPGGIQDPQYRDWDDGDPGAFDPHARLREMDAEGVDVSVLFPTLGLFAPLVPEPDAEAAYCAVLNDFYAGYCSANPARLRGVAMLPLKDVGAAVREVRRAAERRFVAVCLRPNPDPHTRQQVADPRLEPLWATIEEAGMAACFHEGVNPILPFAGVERCTSMFDWHVVSHPFEQMLAMMTVIRAGVLERHPELRIGFMESNCGWLPYWLARMDSNWKALSRMVPEIRMRPSEYFARQCFITAEADEASIPIVAQMVGPDCMVWSSDYPHYDAEWPGAVEEMLARDDLTPDLKGAVLGGNAARWYRLPVVTAPPVGTGGRSAET
jgi:predicted TIM-barrel fold metal-dependent hydrolase